MATLQRAGESWEPIPAPDLLVSVVACPENAGVKCVGHNGRNICSVDGTLCRVASVVPANVGMVERVASGFGVNGQSMGVVLAEQGSERRQSGGAVELS